MQVYFGTDAASPKDGKPVPVIWDTQRLINGHMLIVGKSGTGKTYTLRDILRQMQAASGGRLRVHVMDVHGDIDIDGASSVKFSESTPYGFNPLMVNPDPDFGGVRKRIQAFMAALNRTGYRLGSKQEAALRNILQDLYAANGFHENDAKSWRLQDGVQRQFPKKHPTMEDAVRFANSKLRSMFLGTSSEAVALLDQLYRKQASFHTKLKNKGKIGKQDEIEAMEKELAALGEDCVALYKEHIDKIQTGHELSDLIRYDSKDVMKGVVDRLQNLNSIGIFRPVRPPFDPNASIWRYDIKALAQEEKKLFVAFILEAIFNGAVQRGVQNEVVEVIVLDEAHLFLTDDPDNPINMIAKEARKFGLALLAASQSPTHFSDDFISNVSTKILLGIDQMFWDGTVRKLKIEQKALEWIVAQQRIIIQMNNKGETRNKPLWTYLPRG